MRLLAGHLLLHYSLRVPGASNARLPLRLDSVIAYSMGSHAVHEPKAARIGHIVMERGKSKSLRTNPPKPRAASPRDHPNGHGREAGGRNDETQRDEASRAHTRRGEADGED